MAKLYTSISPKMTRSVLGAEVGRIYTELCLFSWKRGGFDVVSLNNERERKQLEELGINAEIVIVQQERPTIEDFINKAISDGQEFAGIANGDCFFCGSQSTVDSLAESASDRLVMIERLNIKSESLRPTGQSCFGFDAFFFNPTMLKSIHFPRNLMLGHTWWDYWFPYAFMEAGFDLVRSSIPLLIHLDHTQRWQDSQYISTGKEFINKFRNSKGLDFLQRHVNTPTSDVQVGAIAGLVFLYLNTVAPKKDFLVGSTIDRMVSSFISNMPYAEKVQDQIHEQHASLESWCQYQHQSYGIFGNAKIGAALRALANFGLAWTSDKQRIHLWFRRVHWSGSVMIHRSRLDSRVRRAAELEIPMIKEIIEIRNSYMACSP